MYSHSCELPGWQATRRLRIALVASILLMTACATGPVAWDPEPLAAIELPEPSRVRMVAPDGSDDASGAEGDPWATLSHALPQLAAGDRLWVRGGTYVEDIRVEATAGAEEAPVQILAWPGETPVVEGLLWLRQPSWWHVRGLEVTWRDDLDTEQHLVKVTGGVGWTLEGLRVHDAQAFAAVLVTTDDDLPDEPADWRITGSCITDTRPSNDTNQDHLIYVNTGLEAPGGLIDHNVLVGAANGHGVKLAGPGDDEGGAVGVVVSDNVIGEVVHGVLIGGESADNTISDNRFYAIGDGRGAIRSFVLQGLGNMASGNRTTEGTAVLDDHRSPDVQIADDGGNSDTGAPPDARPVCPTLLGE